MDISTSVVRQINESLSLALRENVTYAELREQVQQQVNHLINYDFNLLVHILYRMDVNEQKLKSLLAENSSTDAAQIIAGLIIERQIQKVNSRMQFKKGNTDIPDDEKW